MLSTMEQRMIIGNKLREKGIHLGYTPQLQYISNAELKIGMIVEARYLHPPWYVLNIESKTITFLRPTFEIVDRVGFVFSKICFEEYVEIDMSIKYGYGGKVKSETITNMDSGITHKLIGGVIICGSDSTQDTVVNEHLVNCKKCLLNKN